MTEYNLQNSHQPELLRQLREKSLLLHNKIEDLSAANRQKSQLKLSLQQQLKKVKDQTQVQNRKNKSLIVLLNQLQQTYHSQYLQQKQEKQLDEIGLNLQNSVIRFLLIRLTEDVKQAQKTANFMKHILLDKNKSKAKQFIKKSNFIQGQSQLIAKLKSQIYLLRNENLECKRKWYQLQQQTKNLQSHNKLLSIQKQRQKSEIKLLYEQYLQRINEAKTKVVSFNETQRQSTINQHFVKEIAVLQQRRVEIQEESNNLQFHFENLREEMQRIQVQNKELNGFFQEAGNEGTLAQKMRKRIEQLRDVLIQCKKKNKNTRGAKLRKALENIKNSYNLLLEGNDYVEIKAREQQTFGSFLEEKPIADFFSKLLSQKDQLLFTLKEEELSLKQSLKEAKIQKQLIENQITNLEQNLNFDSWETKFTQNKNWSEVPERGPQKKGAKKIEQGNSGDGESREEKNNSSQGWRNYQNFTFDERRQ